MRWLLAAFIMWASTLPGAAVRAAEPVDVALVLVTDVSRSVSDDEYDLMKRGYAGAFTDRDVIAAIKGGMAGGIAVNYVEFAGAGQVRTVLDWTVIRDEAAARDFAARLLAAPRSFFGRTAIGEGIAHAMHELGRVGVEPMRRVIDVCGDGTSNNGRDVGAARDAAVEAGVTINGLAIINEHPSSWTFAHVQPPGGLDNYYRENVTGGVGSFVLEIRDFRSFGEAIKKKLLNEIASLGPPSRL